jgi:tRNA (mo5U34)-methyltransferase
MTTGRGASTESAIRRRIDAHARWHHTIDLAPGIATPGAIDLRPISGALPWPDVRDKRCLDVGTGDGWFAFELERRGAAEVIAVDAAVHGTGRAADGRGFRLVADELASAVDWRECSVYELDPDELGQFEVVVCADVLWSLTDPQRALHAVRSVTKTLLLSVEPVDLWSSIIARGRPRFIDGGARSGVSARFNAAGQRSMLFDAGFETERASAPFVVPAGRGADTEGTAPPDRMTALVTRVVTRSAHRGVLHRALVARPKDR